MNVFMLDALSCEREGEGRKEGGKGGREGGKGGREREGGKE